MFANAANPDSSTSSHAQMEHSFAQPASYPRLGTAAVTPVVGPRGSAPAATSAVAVPASDMSVAGNIPRTDAVSDSITQLSNWQRQQREQMESFRHND